MGQEQTSGPRRLSSRRELTSVAIECFARRGFRGTSIDLIARMAGVTKGALYYHFSGKEDLLAAAVRDRIEAFENRIGQACENSGPLQSLERIAKVCAEHARSNDEARFVIKLLTESIDTNETISAELRGMMRRFRAFLRNLIADGQAAGDFNPDCDAETLAATYTSSVLGAEIQFYQDPEKFPFEGALDGYLDQLKEALTGRPGSGDNT